MQATVNWDAILSKLEKLDNLAANGGTEAEAQAASEALTRLLVKHNLTLSEFKRRTGNKTKEDYVKDGFAITRRGYWREDLLNSLARLHFCRMLRRPVHGGGVWATLVGEPDNITVVRRMFVSLEAEIEALTDQAWRSARNSTWTHGKTWKNSYRLGVVSGFYHAMQRGREQAIEEQANGSALALLKDEEADSALERFFPKVKNTTLNINRLDGSAYAQGYAKGQTLQANNKLAG